MNTAKGSLLLACMVFIMMQACTGERDDAGPVVSGSDRYGPGREDILEMYPGPDVDAVYHPGETVPYAQVVVERARRRIDTHGGQLDRSEFEAVLAMAGWPPDLWQEAATVAWCESRWSPYATGDTSSLGLFQLWNGWFAWAGYDGEQWNNPVVNASVALAVVRRDKALGRGYWYQWSCKP